MSAENKEMVVRFYDELFGHGNLAAIDKFVGAEYIQHNPHAPDGPDALRGFVTGFRARYPGLRHTVVRVVAEDDLVLLHTKAVLGPGVTQAVADIFRVRDGKIVEHWDVMQQVPDSTVSGNDMFATLSGPDPQPSTAQSRKVALALFTEGRESTVAGPYYQHNPQQPDGALEMFANRTVSIKRVIAEDDLVAIHHHLTDGPDDPGFAVVDLFRVQTGRVVEHWDVIQPVPATSANTNTMF